MAKNATNETKAEVETETVDTEAPKAVEVAPEVAKSASERLADAEKAYKELAKTLKAEAKTETKAYAVDLVNATAAKVVAELVKDIGFRGLKVNNFTIRFDGKAADENKRVKTIVGVVRMSEDERATYLVNYPVEVVEDAALESVIDAVVSPEATEPSENEATE